MAKLKYFHAKNINTGSEFLVQELKMSSALIAVAGNPRGIKPATDEQIGEHFAEGGTLHEKSKPEGEGRLFLIKGESTQDLIRAKNAGEAFGLLNDGSYEIALASQDVLVRLLTAGVKTIPYNAPAPAAPKETKVPEPAPEAAASSADPAPIDPSATIDEPAAPLVSAEAGADVSAKSAAEASSSDSDSEDQSAA